MIWEPVLGGPRRAAGLPPFATRQASGHRSLLELPVLLIAAAVIAFVLKTFVAQAFYIPSPSMDPTLAVGDRVVVSKLSYRMHEVRRGDVIVFECPPAADCRPPVRPSSNPVVRVVRGLGEGVGLVQPAEEEYIKRVVALPGEVVEGRDGHVFVDGKLLVEPYLPDGVTTSSFAPRTVPPGQLFVLGDNRANSVDSRRFGPIQRFTVEGRAIVVAWPPWNASFL